MQATVAATGWWGFQWDPLYLLGFAGNLIFGCRFLVQWIASERKRQSVIPVSFWWLSIIGSLVQGTYFLIQREPVGILSSVPNSIVYVRNLQLVRRHKITVTNPPGVLGSPADGVSTAPKPPPAEAGPGN
ncbi:MAG TPA: lipid-A-disaccharide synthase N-terminal domain-containing protein [Planctomycetota bacterium]|jgi:lipid-A-disaccharide synthase-like uncharacterized protein|nr:lipid-A-disaccharide synthase N-terminal domain-containing protein [Planctomycetota bacterium]